MEWKRSRLLARSCCGPSSFVINSPLCLSVCVLSHTNPLDTMCSSRRAQLGIVAYRFLIQLLRNSDTRRRPASAQPKWQSRCNGCTRIQRATILYAEGLASLLSTKVRPPRSSSSSSWSSFFFLITLLAQPSLVPALRCNNPVQPDLFSSHAHTTAKLEPSADHFLCPRRVNEPPTKSSASLVNDEDDDDNEQLSRPTGETHYGTKKSYLPLNLLLINCARPHLRASSAMCRRALSRRRRAVFQTAAGGDKTSAR